MEKLHQSNCDVSFKNSDWNSRKIPAHFWHMFFYCHYLVEVSYTESGQVFLVTSLYLRHPYLKNERKKFL